MRIELTRALLMTWLLRFAEKLDYRFSLVFIFGNMFKYAKIFGDYFWLSFIHTEDLGDHFFLILCLLKILATHSCRFYAYWRSWRPILADFMPTGDLGESMATHSCCIRSCFIPVFKKYCSCYVLERSCKGLPVWGLTKRGWYEMVWLYEML